MKNSYLKLKKAFKENREKNKTMKSQIPNILTFSRALAPFIVTPLILTGNIIPGLIAGAALASTDFFDGKLARKWHVESEFGSLLDQIVDKIFSITLLVTGAILNPIILLNIIPEIAIAANNSYAYNKGIHIESSLIGKIKTWLLSINILLSFIPGLSFNVMALSTFITFATQSIVYFDYSGKASKQIQNAKREEIQNIIREINAEKTKAVKKNKVMTRGSQIRNQKIELLKYKKFVLSPNQQKVYKQVKKH